MECECDREGEGNAMRDYVEEMLDGGEFENAPPDTNPNHTIHNSHKEREFYASELLRVLEARCRKLREKEPTGWRAIPCGSIRRQMCIVHDLDVVLFMEDESKTESVKQFFEEQTFPWHADFRVCTKGNLGAMMLYLTGDKQHNISMRIHAANMKLQLNEYGLFDRAMVKRLAGETEKGIYARLGLLYLIPRKRSFRLMKQTKLALEVGV